MGMFAIIFSRQSQCHDALQAVKIARCRLETAAHKLNKEVTIRIGANNTGITAPLDKQKR